MKEAAINDIKVAVEALRSKKAVVAEALGKKQSEAEMQPVVEATCISIALSS